MNLKLKSLLASALMALAFTSCSDVEEFIMNDYEKGIVLFTAENPGVDEADGTRVSVGKDDNGKIYPRWDAGDKLAVYYEVTMMPPIDESMPMPEEYSISGPLEAIAVGTGKETSFTVENDFFDYFDGNGNLYFTSTGMTVDGSGTGVLSSLTGTVTSPATITKKSLENISEGDVLVSRRYKYKGTPIKGVEFKRLSGVVAINISDATTDKSLDGQTISEFSIKSPKSTALGAKELVYDFLTEKVTRLDLVENSQTTVKFSEGCNALMDGNHTFYFSVLPFEISGNAGETAFEITFNTNNGYVINKVLNFGNSGTIKFEAGRYTTMNISIKDEDVTLNPAYMPEYTVGGGVITMVKPGYLTSKMVSEAMTTKGITINGDINATDIQAIKDVMNGTESCNVKTSNGRYDLNLRNANIVAGGKPFKTHFQLQPGMNVEVSESVTKDNTLPKCFIDNIDTKVGDIALPSSLKELDAFAIWINERIENADGITEAYSRQVTLNGNIETINGPWVRMFNWPTIYFAINPPKHQKGDWNNAFSGLVPGQCNIIAYRSWKQHMIDNNIGQNGTFFNRIFHSIRLVNHEADKDYFVENIYNAIDYLQVVTAGSGEINMRGSSTLSAWMIKKAIDSEGIVRITGRLGASDIAAIKTVSSGAMRIGSSFVIDITKCDIVADGSKYVYIDEKGKEKTQFSEANTLTAGYIDRTDKCTSVINFPNSITTIKSNAVNCQSYHMKDICFGQEKNGEAFNLTTIEDNSIKIKNLGGIYFYIPYKDQYSKIFDNKAFVLKNDGKLPVMQFFYDEGWSDLLKSKGTLESGEIAGAELQSIMIGGKVVYQRW